MVEKFYKIGEVAKILDLPPSTLRYWESHFKHVRPVKSTGGQRFYTEKHIEMLTQLKEMLYSERYTIEGAKQRLKELNIQKEANISLNTDENSIDGNNSLNDSMMVNKEIIKRELKEILVMLEQ